MERELDAAIAAAARARSEKRQAEAAQRSAELRAQDITRELENTTSMSLDVTRQIYFKFFRCHYNCMLEDRKNVRNN